jgi:hypothetical protein
MKKITLLVGFLVALLILGAMSAPTVSAQALDGVWLKGKITVKGYAFDPGTGDFSKSNESAPFYLHFIWSAIDNHYNVLVWTVLLPQKVWLATSPSVANTVMPGENFIPNFHLFFRFSSTHYFFTYHTPFISYKPGKSGTTQITYKGTGEVYGGKLEGGTKDYYGYFTISGTSVDESQLPFIPIEP